jgi:hypothetical protein
MNYYLIKQNNDVILFIPGEINYFHSIEIDGEHCYQNNL